MVDITLIQQDPKAFRDAVSRKQMNPAIVDEVLRVAAERLQLLKEVEIIRQSMNAYADGIKKSGQKPSDD
jgi:seryl-tRNA synthetase